MTCEASKFFAKEQLIRNETMNAMLQCSLHNILTSLGVNKLKKQLLFIHSAGSQKSGQGSSGLAAFIKSSLGEEYHVLCPRMPEPENPQCTSWQEQLKEEFSLIKNDVMLIGHSLGGSVLLKFLCEEEIDITIAGLFLIAAPFWGSDDNWQNDEFMLPEGFPSTLPSINNLVLYHSKDDPIVPFTHMEHYKKHFSHAHARVLEGDDHYFHEGLPRLIADVQKSPSKNDQEGF